MSSAAVTPASSGSPHGLAEALADTRAALDVLAGQPLWAVTNSGLLDTAQALGDGTISLAHAAVIARTLNHRPGVPWQPGRPVRPAPPGSGPMPGPDRAATPTRLG